MYSTAIYQLKLLMVLIRVVHEMREAGAWRHSQVSKSTSFLPEYELTMKSGAMSVLNSDWRSQSALHPPLVFIDYMQSLVALIAYTKTS